MSFTLEEQLVLAAQTARAPSPHNTQPARWRFTGDGVDLYECVERRLAAGDPTGRDQAIALGASWEGMALAISIKGWTLGAPQRVNGDGPVRRYAGARVTKGGKPDPLAAAVLIRRAHRGLFPEADAARTKRLDELALRWPMHTWVRNASELAAIARQYDAAAAGALRDPAVAAELYRWMRFSPRHPNWARDGLAADCLTLSSFEAWGGSIAMRPGVLRVLVALGMGGLLVSETAKVRSATALAILLAPRGEDPFVTGRAFYRFWLDLAASGFSAVPMSALADSPEHARALLATYAGGKDVALINVFRVGPTPDPPPPESARLPPEELLVP